MARKLYYDFLNNPSLSGHDDATSTPGTPDLSITRATKATMVDADGYIREVQSGEARFTGATFAHNYLQQSEVLENAYWSKTNVTASDGADTINGVALTQITDDATSGVHAVQTLNRRNLNIRSIFSVYVKGGTARYIAFSWRVSFGGNVSVFDTQTGAWTTEDGAYDVHGVTDLGGGYYRIYVVDDGVTGTFDDVVIGFSQDSTGTVSYSGSGDTLFIGGIMAEDDPTGARTTPSSYIATTTTEVSSLTGTSTKGILVEEARTQLAIWTEDISNAAWVASNITKGTTAVTAPDGASNSNVRLTASAGNGTLLQTLTSASATRVYSVYMKRVTGTGNVDLTLDGGSTWTTQTLTSEWQRFYITQAAVTNPSFGVRIVTSGDAIDFWGSELNSGATFPTSYISNNSATASVTRNKDDVSTSSFTGSGVTGATVYFKGSVPYVGTANARMYQFDQTTGGDRIILSRISGVSTRLLSDGNGDGATISATSDWSNGSDKRVVVGLAANDAALYVDGSQVGTDATYGYIEATDSIYVGELDDGTGQWNGHISEIAYWDERLLDTQLSDLSDGTLAAGFSDSSLILRRNRIMKRRAKARRSGLTRIRRGRPMKY